MAKNDGGPAFPSGEDCEDANGTWTDRDFGMSLRDWFAGRAMQGLCSHPDTIALHQKVADKHRMSRDSVTAIDAYDLADAMLVEREKGRDDADAD